MNKCGICGQEALKNHVEQYHKILTEYNKTTSYEAKTRGELNKEIKKLADFINIASFENPMNLGPDKEKLEGLKNELASLGEAYDQDVGTYQLPTCAKEDCDNTIWVDLHGGYCDEHKDLRGESRRKAKEDYIPDPYDKHFDWVASMDQDDYVCKHCGLQMTWDSPTVGRNALHSAPVSEIIKIVKQHLSTHGITESRASEAMDFYDKDQVIDDSPMEEQLYGVFDEEGGDGRAEWPQIRRDFCNGNTNIDSLVSGVSNSRCANAMKSVLRWADGVFKSNESKANEDFGLDYQKSMDRSLGLLSVSSHYNGDTCNVCRETPNDKREHLRKHYGAYFDQTVASEDDPDYEGDQKTIKALLKKNGSVTFEDFLAQAGDYPQDLGESRRIAKESGYCNKCGTYSYARSMKSHMQDNHPEVPRSEWKTLEYMGTAVSGDDRYVGDDIAGNYYGNTDELQKAMGWGQKDDGWSGPSDYSSEGLTDNARQSWDSGETTAQDVSDHYFGDDDGVLNYSGQSFDSLPQNVKDAVLGYTEDLTSRLMSMTTPDSEEWNMMNDSISRESRRAREYSYDEIKADLDSQTKEERRITKEIFDTLGYDSLDQDGKTSLDILRKEFGGESRRRAREDYKGDLEEELKVAEDDLESFNDPDEYSKQTDYIWSLKNSLAKYEKLPPRNNESHEYTCTECGDKFGERDEYVDHQNTHKEES